MSQESRKKISDSRKGLYCGKDNPNFGKHHLQETKEKIRIGNLGKTLSKESILKRTLKQIKPISQWDLNGNLIKIWSSIKEASIEMNTCESNLISVCKGQTQTARGYKWTYHC